MDDFGTAGLHNAAHDINGCVMPVKKAGGSDNANFVLRLVGRYLLHQLRYWLGQSNTCSTSLIEQGF
jgi:hypothetical protein